MYCGFLLAMNMGCKDAVKAFLNNMGISVKTRVLNNGKLHWRSYSVDVGVMIMQECIND